MSLRRNLQSTVLLPKFSQKVNKSLITDLPPVSSKEYHHESRNIPHTKRVIHIKGLNDMPICFVRGAEKLSENLTNPFRKLETKATNNVSTKRTPVEKKTECRHSEQGDNQETKDLIKFCEFLHKDSKTDVNIWILKASAKALMHHKLMKSLIPASRGRSARPPSTPRSAEQIATLFCILMAMVT